MSIFIISDPLSGIQFFFRPREAAAETAPHPDRGERGNDLSPSGPIAFSDACCYNQCECLRNGDKGEHMGKGGRTIRLLMIANYVPGGTTRDGSPASPKSEY